VVLQTAESDLADSMHRACEFNGLDLKIGKDENASSYV
jgi:hypothetical protein